MLKRIKGVTPGQRHRVRMKVDTEGGRKKVPLSLRYGKRKKGGRNQTGRITVHHRGGGVKRLRRKRVNAGQEGGVGKVLGIQYDPNRTTRLALVESLNLAEGYKYVLAAEGLKTGERIQYGDNWVGKEKEEKERERKRRKGERKVKDEGSTKKRKKREVGGSVFNRELEKGKGGKYVRAAGGSARILRKEEKTVVVRRKTGERRELSGDCTGTQGKASGEEHRMEKIGKAGRNRRKGKRPKVRGEAMNPVDHPHGGRTRGGRPEVTPWGKRAKGVKTRNKKKTSRFVIKE